MTDQLLKTIVISQPWVDAFANWLAQERSPLTVQAYRQDLAHFCAWFERINHTPFSPELMNSLDARQYRTWCLDVEKCAPATWNRRRATLAILCQYSEEELELKLFKFKRKVATKATQDEAPHWLSQEDERKILRQAEINLVAAKTAQQRARAQRDWAMLAIMRFTGLRVAEVAALEIGNLCLGERSGEVTVRKGKGDKERHPKLSTSVRDALRDWIAVRGDQPGALFSDLNGAAITKRAIQKRIEALRKQCQVNVSCHMLRHTCAKRMLDGGANLSEVKRTLGHKKLETTLRYITPGDEDLQSAVDAGELGTLGRVAKE
jgi:integrase/recombinase XerC